MTHYFDQDVVIVTGGGRGIGRAHCVTLARCGARVVVNDVHGEAADEVVAAIQEAGGEAVASHASVTTPAGAQAIVDIAHARFRRIDGLINNAGSMANALFEDITPEMLDQMIDVHLRGAFFVTQAAWPYMRGQNYGRIVMTSSSGGMFAAGGSANYNAAKAALYGLCKSLAYEGREHGILVNALLPFAQTTISVGSPLPGFAEGFPPGLREALAPRRLTEAVAPLAAYLTSRQCSITGEAFSAGMGHFARIFVGAAQGWTAHDPANVTLDEVSGHMSQIRNLEGHTVPKTTYEELEAIAQAIGLTYA